MYIAIQQELGLTLFMQRRYLTLQTVWNQIRADIDLNPTRLAL